MENLEPIEKSKKNAKIAFFMIILAGLLWGTSAIFVHYLAPFGFSSLQMVAARGSVSFICLFVYALCKKQSLFRITPLELLLFALIGASLFFAAYCYYSSMQSTSVATAVMLMGLAPVYVVLFSTLVLKEKISPLKGISVAGILTGGILVSGIVGGMVFDGFGIFMGIASGVSYAAYNVLTKICMQRHSDAGSASLYSFFFMALIAVSASKPWKAFRIISEKPAETLPWLIGIGLATFVIPYVLYTVSLKSLSAGTASALGVIEPLSATLFSVFLFDEKLTGYSIAGIVLILVSVVLLGKATTNETEKK